MARARFSGGGHLPDRRPGCECQPQRGARNPRCHSGWSGRLLLLPSVTASLSIVDGITGRPETALDPSNVSPSPTAKVTAVSPSTASLPAAYVVLIDTSGSMGYKAADGRTYMATPRAWPRRRGGRRPRRPGEAGYVRRNHGVKTGGSRATTRTSARRSIRFSSKPGRHTSPTDSCSRWIANGRPSGYDRRAVVVITDASPPTRTPTSRRR